LEKLKKWVYLTHDVNPQNMSTAQEIQSFLQDFKAKLGVWGVVFRDNRGKNAKAL
jgi:hypothetical protein